MLNPGTGGRGWDGNFFFGTVRTVRPRDNPSSGMAEQFAEYQMF
jgi:hypothetical protein